MAVKEPTLQDWNKYRKSMTQFTATACNNKRINITYTPIILPDSSHPNGMPLQSTYPQSSRGRGVACSLVKHGLSSQSPCNYVTPSVLLAATDPASFKPHGWQVDGDEAWEVMSPREGSPLPKLKDVPRRLESNAAAIGFYSTDESVRHSLVVPSIGTGASQRQQGSGAVRGESLEEALPKRGVQRSCGSNGALQLSAPAHEPNRSTWLQRTGARVARFLGSMERGASPKSPGCRGHWRATNDPPVVPAVPELERRCGYSRATVRQSSLVGGPAVGHPKQTTEKQEASNQDGYRRPAQISTLCSDHRAVGCEGGTAKTPPLTLVNSGVAADWFEEPLNPLARTPDNSRSAQVDSSRKSCSTAMQSHNCAEGYRIYQKDAKEEIEEEHSMRSCQGTRPPRAKKSAQNGAQTTPNSINPLRLHAEPLIFGGFDKSADAAPHTQPKRRQNQIRGKQVEKYKHMARAWSGGSRVLHVLARPVALPLAVLRVAPHFRHTNTRSLCPLIVDTLHRAPPSRSNHRLLLPHHCLSP